MLLKRLSFDKGVDDYSEKFMQNWPILEKRRLTATYSLQDRGREGVKGLVNGIIAVSSLTLSRFWPRISFIKRFPAQCNSRNWLLVESSKCEALIGAAACTANKIQS